MRLVVLGTICLLFLSAPSMLPAAETVTLPNCLLSLDEEADIPAQEAGVLVKIPVREGQQVVKGELLAQIEDSLPRMQYNVAGYKLKVAEKEAGDDISIRYAQIAAKVAEVEHQQAVDANNKVTGAVPLAEVRRLLLKHREMVLSIEKAQKEMAIAALQVKVSEAEVQAAAANLERYRITAPLDAVVVELSRHEGEWVQPGDPVMRLVRVDRLRVEGFLNAQDHRASEIQGRPVKVVVTLARRHQETFSGKIVYVKPLVEAGGEFLVRAEVENRRQGDVWVLSPGLSAEMTIQSK
ncbi:MAG: HlyD family efflux transporter periplasmic adaptor subunit [Planctomycetes bacterium]|nr:HlyD family efflux transporter periplasmic adaptor subunit [Planctomycetota bacterium]MCG2682965.1 HlyD family efflux transporter periplasmic adaptor subunit [Planctomycetales bacterium]